ncbi:phosphate-starvation-inducible PsiE family protein [Pelagibacteraceae bacterium]|jgi:protein PsiE|nr:phosphate-starvation-inducible PsiE family protein [Pelagibacteraceae bacterium]|tara:strand:+ start:1380 stop:1766 length:387 start_codon:yes stop_codon:yes gene_type:complete
MNSYFELLEKIVLSVLIVCTIIAIGMEIQGMIAVYKVTLADILLLFIYIEIIGMIKEYWVSKMIRMSYPLFIAMTALARMIIMQRKDVDPSAYVYESVAILILAIAIVVLRVRHMEILNRRSKKLPDD